MATTTTEAGALVEQGTPLARNHWFDGKFLRADDLARDQDYHRNALRLANQAGGHGVVRGLEPTLNGAELTLQPGLGVTADGELLLLSSDLVVGVDALIAATAASPAGTSSSTASPTPAPAPATPSAGNPAFAPCVSVATPDAEPLPDGLRVYRLTLGPWRALCGFEDVVGALCERACVTERQRPYQLDGVRLRARAQALALAPLPGYEAGPRHLRSRIASALFALEDRRIAPLPDDGGRLLSALWCSGTQADSSTELTLGYLVRGPGVADFIDLWAGRRERMAAQAQGYWQRRTRLRPLADFIAQVAQFQCQLAGLLGNNPVPADEGGDCESLRLLVNDLQQQLKNSLKADDGSPVGATEWTHATSAPVMQQLGRFVLQSATLLKSRPDRVLPDRGFVELPPAGFLPVVPAAGDVLAQVQRLVGPGVDLQVCSAPLDAIGHLFEEAQHSARSALTRGLADPANKERLQIIVPDGELQAAPPPPAPAPGFDVALHSDPAVMLLLLSKVMETGGDNTTAGASIGTSTSSNATSSDSNNIDPADTAASLRRAQAALGRDATTLDSGDGGDGAAPKTTGQGAGRNVVGNGQPPVFALAVRGRSPTADAPLNADDFEASWTEAQAAQDPFAAAPGAAVALQMRVKEADTAPAQSPAGLRIGLDMTAQVRLVLNDDPAVAEASRAAIEAVTGISGGDLRLAALRDGVLRFRRTQDGVPTTPDQVSDGSVPFATNTVVLQRAGTAGAMRWAVAIPLIANTGNGTTTSGGGVLVLDLLPPAGDGWLLQLRSVRLGQSGLTQLEPSASATQQAVVLPLATLRSDPQALVTGSAPRVAAEAGLARLATVLGTAAPDAAAQARLWGPASMSAPATTGMRAVHDWLLFRRHVDPRCGVSAPVVPAAVTTRYQSAVLSLVANFNGDALKTTLEALDRGELPTTKAAVLQLAGAVDYADDSDTPLQTAAQLRAAFAQASGNLAVVASVGVVQAASGVAPSLEQRRFLRLAALVGSGEQPRLLFRTLPTQMQALDGAVVYIVQSRGAAPAGPAPSPVPNPPPIPAPPPPAAPAEPAGPVVSHRQRVLLLRQEAVSVLAQLGGVAVFATRAESMLKRLEVMAVGTFEVDATLHLGNVSLQDSGSSGLSGLGAAAAQLGGLGSDLLPTLLRSSDDTADKRSNAGLAAAALFHKLQGTGGAAQVVVCNPSPTLLQVGQDALTLLFTKG